MRVGFEGPRATARTLMKEGEKLFVALSWSDHAPRRRRTYDEAYERLVWTAHHWQHWLDHAEFPDHPWRTFLQRSALTLKGLSYAPTGALVAAATTSLPETPGGERNWDYRYTLDPRLDVHALGPLHARVRLGGERLLPLPRRRRRGRGEELQIMYGIGGETELPETTLDHLSGYEGARPVRIGNDAYRQSQHDVWGAILDSFYLHTKSRDQLPERIWPILVKQVEAALEHWREPDHGIWEVRGEPKHFTSSKVMCWVAADRGARLAEIRGDAEYAERWQAAADEIKRDICEQRPRRARRLLPALRHDRARRVCAPAAARALPPARRRADPGDRVRDRRRADGRRARPALPDGGDRRRPARARRAPSPSARSGSSRR